MLAPNFVDSQSGIRLRFKITDPDGLHQAQLFMDGVLESGSGDRASIYDCKSLKGKNVEVEFISRELLAFRNNNNDVWIRIIDLQGNF